MQRTHSYIMRLTTFYLVELSKTLIKERPNLVSLNLLIGSMDSVGIIPENYIIYFLCFSTDNQHSYGYQLCSSRRSVPSFVCSRLYAGVSQRKRKEATSFNFTLRCMDSVLTLGCWICWFFLSNEQTMSSLNTESFSRLIKYGNAIVIWTAKKYKLTKIWLKTLISD